MTSRRPSQRAVNDSSWQNSSPSLARGSHVAPVTHYTLREFWCATWQLTPNTLIVVVVVVVVVVIVVVVTAAATTTTTTKLPFTWRQTTRGRIFAPVTLTLTPMTRWLWYTNLTGRFWRRTKNELSKLSRSKLSLVRASQTDVTERINTPPSRHHTTMVSSVVRITWQSGPSDDRMCAKRLRTLRGSQRHLTDVEWHVVV